MKLRTTLAISAAAGSGFRIYTFITTFAAAAGSGGLATAIGGAGPAGAPAGRPVEGLTLLPGWEYFVCAGPMPMRQPGMTSGRAWALV